MTYDEQIASDYAKLREIHRPLLRTLILDLASRLDPRFLSLAAAQAISALPDRKPGVPRGVSTYRAKC